MTSSGGKNWGFALHLLSVRDPWDVQVQSQGAVGCMGLEFRGNSWARDIRSANTFPVVVAGVGKMT